MKIDQNVIVSVVVGIVIGGVAMGFIDSNRPQPLFMSASYTSCESFRDSANSFMRKARLAASSGQSRSVIMNWNEKARASMEAYVECAE